MEPALSTLSTQPPVLPTGQLSGNSRQGVRRANPALISGFEPGKFLQWHRDSRTLAPGKYRMSWSCEFGACGVSGNPFQAGAAGVIGVTIVCQIAEPCGAVEDALFVLTTVGVAGYDIYQMSKGGKQEVGHDYVRDMARAEGGDYCSALKRIVDAAKKSGNSKLFRDAKATYKQDCRGF